MPDQNREAARWNWSCAFARAAAVAIVDVSTPLFDAAIDLYRQRPDKRYSLVDCLGMVICRERSITDVLTTDGDFAAEGFTVLLKP